MTIEQVIYWGAKLHGGFVTLATAKAILRKAKTVADIKRELNKRKTTTAARTTPGQDIQKHMSRFLGENAWMMRVPELARIAVFAIGEGWDPTRITGAVQNSTWYKTSNETQRSWPTMTQGDREQAIRSVAQQMAQAWQQVYGEPTDPAKFINDGSALNIANGSMPLDRWIWDIQRAASEAGVGTAANEIENDAESLRNLARGYLIPFTDEQAFRWAEDISTGKASEADFVGWLRNQAAGMFPGISEQIMNGVEPETLLGSYAEIASSELERPVTLHDPWVLNSLTGGQVPSLGDWRRQVRARDEWKFTDRANSEAADIAAGLLETFGQVVF
jgi:hypothetical protein